MLYTDKPPCTIGDLSDRDSQAVATATMNQIDLNTKIRLAEKQIRTEIQVWLDRPVTTTNYIWRPVTRIEQVVQTDELTDWAAILTLESLYEDSYFAELVDRYGKKLLALKRRRRTAYEAWRGRGLALVGVPVPRAAQPALSTAPAASGGGTFYCTASWTSANATLNNQEGAPSLPQSIAIGDGSELVITPGPPPKLLWAETYQDTITGWNAYAGSSLGSMQLQNAQPLPLGAPLQFTSGLQIGGKAPGNGQHPDFRRPLARTMLRG